MHISDKPLINMAAMNVHAPSSGDEIHVKSEKMKELNDSNSDMGEYYSSTFDDSHQDHNISVIDKQALPVPKLTTGPAFYCRKTWLCNTGIHDCGCKKICLFGVKTLPKKAATK
ncbi:hypothetical protein HHI36_012325 [Cryptolaemus montrouzieri]|uniref:Uncharacterized protein n=1 Tax=Cryptolaemus montrouzieri TaxID=559131 RepID=A0ABD2NDY0_9CUCU